MTNLRQSLTAVLLMLGMFTSAATAAEPVKSVGSEPAAKSWRRSVPDYLCLCPSYCPKPCPPVCWDLLQRCDDYCAKQLPCPCVPPLRQTCDCYDCKPLPLCFPPAPCGKCCPERGWSIFR